MSPMMIDSSTAGPMGDCHIVPLGSRVAGRFGLVLPGRLAITPGGRAGAGRGGIHGGAQSQGPDGRPSTTSRGRER
jgi:hypothetical protein